MFPAFWDYGHELYRSTPDTFPATCLVGDVLDPNFLPPGTVSIRVPESPCHEIQSLTSFCSLKGRVSAIYVARFFHLFNEEEQEELACKFASLLSPEPGSTIFGAQIGIPERSPTDSSSSFFCHSPDSWRELWEDKVFAGHSVKVDGRISQVSEQIRKPGGSNEYLLTWSVVRL